eukprot:gene16768-19939_t
MVINTYDTLSGETTSRVIELAKVNYTSENTNIYVYNSRFYVGITPYYGYDDTYILELDLTNNSSKVLATISASFHQFNNYLAFVFDDTNGFITFVGGIDGTGSPNIDLFSLNLNNNEFTHTLIPNNEPMLNTGSVWLMTTS